MDSLDNHKDTVRQDSHTDIVRLDIRMGIVRWDSRTDIARLDTRTDSVRLDIHTGIAVSVQRSAGPASVCDAAIAHPLDNSQAKSDTCWSNCP